MADGLVSISDPSHPFVGVTAKLLSLLDGLDHAAPDPSIEAVAKAIAKPRQKSAPLLGGFIRRVDTGYWADLRLRGANWRLHVADHALGESYAPTVTFPRLDGRGAFSLRFRGDEAAYLDWARRASTILIFHQR